MKKFNVAVVGATGMVGNKFLEVLTEKQLPVDNYYLFASAKSAGKKIQFMGKEHTVIELTEGNVAAGRKGRFRTLLRRRRGVQRVCSRVCKNRSNSR